jgi:hypothetical protein
MRGRAVWTLLSGVSVLLVSALANAQCTKDTDCKGDRVCDGGKCTSPLPPAPAAPPGSDAAAPPGSDAAAPPGPGATTDAAPADAQPAPAPAAAPVDLQLQASPSEMAPAGATAPLERDEPQTKRRSRGAMIGGIVMVSVGPIALLGALAAKNAQEQCDSNLERDYPDQRLPTSERYRADECNNYSVPLYLFGIGGAVLTAAGIPLIIYGAKNVPNAPPRASLSVLPWAGPTSSGLRLRLDL